MANEVLLTIVSGDAVQVHANAAENTLHQMRAGLKGRVTPTAYPGVRLPVTMQSAPAYPDASGKYDVTLAVDPAVLSGLERRPVPGMTCQVKLIAYDKADALTIPLSALQSDDTNGKTYVTVSGADGKPERRDVQTGQTSGDRIEITAGLADGDKVVMPGADKK